MRHLIREMKFVWAAMITHFLPAKRGERTQPQFGATLLLDMLAANAATAGYEVTERRARVRLSRCLVPRQEALDVFVR